METTGEAEWGLPIFLTTVAAKWTADLFNKGIYDIHIELKHVPLLEQRPEKQMIALQAKEFMTESPVVLDTMTTVASLVQVLSSCEHHGFPVVDPATRHFVGLADRSTLHHILNLGGGAGLFADDAPTTTTTRPRAAAAVLPFEELLRHRHPSVFPSLDDVRSALATSDSFEKVVDLRPYINQGCFTVMEHASAMRCYRLFLGMGLRHLPVLGQDHEVRGIITRQNLIHTQESLVQARATMGPASWRRKSASMAPSPMSSEKSEATAADFNDLESCPTAGVEQDVQLEV